MEIRDRKGDPELLEGMDNAVWLDQSLEFYTERLQLCREKTDTLSAETAAGDFDAYFEALLRFIRDAFSAYDGNMADEKGNKKLYEELEPGHYETSFLNPSYAGARLGAEYGTLLSMWYAEMRALIPYCFEKNIKHITVILETFIQIYNEFEYDLHNETYQAVKDIIYSYLHDYCAEFTEDYIREGLVPGRSLAEEIVLHADLSDPAYLYRYGEWVTEEEKETARQLAQLTEGEIEAMASACTDAYLRKFQCAGRELPAKKTVLVTFPLGFERLIRKAAEQFRANGLAVIFRRQPSHLTDKGLSGNRKPGFYGAENPQYVYDHAEDMALFMGDRFRAEKEQAFTNAYAACAEAAAVFSGTLCVEVSGAEAFIPEESGERLHFTARQQRLFTKLLQKKNEIEAMVMGNHQKIEQKNGYDLCRINLRKGVRVAAAALLLLMLAGCGKEETVSSSDTISETLTQEAGANAALPAAGAESEAAEAEKNVPETAEAASSEETEEVNEPVETDETYPGTLSAQENGQKAVFGIMYATVIEVQKEADGSLVYNLQDVNDPENVWALRDMDIGSVETDLEKGNMAALLFSGDIVRDSENVFFIAAVPYAEYSIGRTEGITENNVMSTFTLRADDGSTFTFLKDNCRIEEGAMRKNAGDAVIVYYAYSEADNIYYPLEIYAADK